MTAIHLFATDRAAIIATDSAYFHDDGTIADFGQKHVGSDEMRFHFAISGRGSVGELCEDLRALLPNGGTQSDWLAAMPKALRAMRERSRREQPHGELKVCNGIGANDVAVFIAMVTDDGPRLLIMSTCPRPDIGLAAAYEFTETEGVVQPAIDVASVLPHGYWRGPRDSRSLFNAQRKAGFPIYDGFGGLGGDCRMTIIERGKVTHKKICAWPDKIGDRISG